MKKLHTATLVITGLALLAAVATLSGCSGKPASSGSTPVPAASNAAPATAPTLVLTAPAASSEVPAGDVKMSVTITGIKFTEPSYTNVAGQGHVHFTLDGEPLKMSVTPDYVYSGVAAGPHKLVAELVQNDTKPFSPPVKQEISFTAK